DPEVRSRARWIQDQWKLGIRPETPEHVRRLLRGSGAVELDQLDGLIVSRQLDGLIAVLNAANAGAMAERLQGSLLRNFPYLAFRSLEQGQSQQFIELLGAMSHIPIVALRRSQMMHEMGISPEACLTLTK